MIQATYQDIIGCEQEAAMLQRKATSDARLFRALRDFGREYARALAQVREDLAALARQFGTAGPDGNIQIDPQRAIEFLPLQADLMAQGIELNISGFKFEEIAPVAPCMAWCIIDAGEGESNQ